MLRVRMASFSHELLNSSQDPVRKTERDRGLTPWNPAVHRNDPTTTFGATGAAPLCTEYQSALSARLTASARLEKATGSAIQRGDAAKKGQGIMAVVG
jgi:hypothetical protein